jgi:hypothetical protein
MGGEKNKYNNVDEVVSQNQNGLHLSSIIRTDMGAERNANNNVVVDVGVGQNDHRPGSRVFGLELERDGVTSGSFVQISNRETSQPAQSRNGGLRYQTPGKNNHNSNVYENGEHEEEEEDSNTSGEFFNVVMISSLK